MPDYQSLKTICLQNNRMSGNLVDNFLIHYAASREKLDHEMKKRLSGFRHVIREFQPEWIQYFKGQYIAHKLFKRGGLIKKYLNHSILKDLRPEDRNYLEHQAENYWKFSFTIIIDRPAEDFYMLTTAGKILKKEINLIEYDTLFNRTPDEGEKDELDNLNEFMQLILPDINSGRKPDIETAARKAGVDLESARDLVQQLTNKIQGKV